MNTRKFGKGSWKTFAEGIQREWVITNGIGGYAGSSIIGAHTRKHNGLLIASLHPPVERFMVLSKINEELKVGDTTYSFATNQRPGGNNEEGQKYLQRFTYEYVPEFTYYAAGVFVTKTIAFQHGKNTVAVTYDIYGGSDNAQLTLVPLFNFREHHQRSERADLKFSVTNSKDTMTLVPEANQDIAIRFYVSEGEIKKRDEIYDVDMELQTEISTGMTCIENNYTPYEVIIDIPKGDHKKLSVVCTIEQGKLEKNAFGIVEAEIIRCEELEKKAELQDDFANTLVHAADQFIVERESTGGKTVLAGLPWFTDWGRDTMIALQGLTLVTKRFADAREILKSFAQYVKKGLVPNMFPDAGLEPLYNTVDASLWYFYAVQKYLEYTGGEEDYAFIQREIYPKLREIIIYYIKGTEFSIYMDQDYLIHAGDGLDQVTWMDVRVGDWVVTPRHGKPVEISALWYNALCVMYELSKRFGAADKDTFQDLAEKVKSSFVKKFWNPKKKCLYDVVDKAGNDDKIRPNQIWAVSLPYTMLSREQEKAVVDTVVKHLYASYGLRSLSPEDGEYKGIYVGKLHDRDAAYHQGTAWGFPLGGLITAYLKVYGDTKEGRRYARKLIAPMEEHLWDGCIGSIAEIFDGNEPNISRGCYGQAWSVGEILRAYVEGGFDGEK
ncbi:MAG: amylo-alpha-1,6-glucosidase [Lachnospiraceae bacterium]|nr:amylo-alpha-1,6-glucosidase [Lachnospiraceae bacterium]